MYVGKSVQPLPGSVKVGLKFKLEAVSHRSIQYRFKLDLASYFQIQVGPEGPT